MYALTTEASFDSAHFLADYNGKCRNIHGHRWNIKVDICGSMLEEDGCLRGMLMDFGDMKKVLKAMADYFDHAFIIEKNSLRPQTLQALKEEDFRIVEVDFRPTAENFAKYFFDELKCKNLPVKQVIVYETPGNCALYSEGA